MGESLNTTVNGSVGTCVEAADYLRDLYQGASMTVGGFESARGKADAAWRGPARDEFSDQAAQVGKEVDTLGDRAFAAEWALRDFADALKAVLDKMDDALTKAAAGGLSVDGPFIATPDPLPPAPVLPTGPCGTAKAAQVMQQNQQAIADHNGTRRRLQREGRGLQRVQGHRDAGPYDGRQRARRTHAGDGKDQRDDRHRFGEYRIHRGVTDTRFRRDDGERSQARV
jgi:uncharacterized protein YukE